MTGNPTERSFWHQRRVLVTGATGLLGSHLTRYLIDAGADVIALVRDEVPRSLFYSNEPGWNLRDRAVTVRGSVEDFALLERTLNEYEVDSVFHLAAQTIVGTANASPRATFETNIAGTWNLLEACRQLGRRVQRIVVASSDKAYGNLQGQAYDESFPLRGSHPYDVSKSCADLIAQSYYHTYGLPVSVTRCGNFFGAGDLNFSRLIPGTLRDVLSGRRPVIRSSGQFIRDYLFVEDGVHAYITLAEAMDAAATHNAGSSVLGEAFNFSYGLRLRVVDVVQRVLTLLGRADLEPVIQNQASNEIPVQCLDSRKAAEQLKWSPQHGFNEGLAMTVDWYHKALSGDPGRFIKGPSVAQP